MKPINLTISGLHSFRDERTIDFQTLCTENLFGVFGPTGSGKTTILDAITLSLFGEVKRAKNNSDFITSGSDSCFVSFTYEITEHSVQKRYTVERQYFHTKPTQAKLYLKIKDASGENTVTVLADKGNAVTAAVESTLGIDKDDFSKAVIIPQGEFAAFLHLTPKHRGNFLKGLFGLNELGNRIDSQINALFASMKGEVERVSWEITGLEKHNNEALAEHTAAFEKAEKEADLCTTEHEKAEKGFREAAQLLEQVTRLSDLTRGSEKREEERQKIEVLELSLRRAADAAEVEGTLNKHREATMRESEARKALEEARLMQQKAEEIIAPLVPQKAKVDDQRGESGIISRLAAEIETLRGLGDIDREIAKSLQEIGTRTDAIAAKKSDLEKTTGEITELNEKGKKLDDEKVALEKSGENEQKSLKDLERKRETIKDLLNASENLTEAAGRVVVQSKEEKISHESLEGLTKESDRLTKEADLLRTTLEERRTELDRRRRDHALAGLLPHLAEGEPCPLCGSEEHPHPHEVGAEEDTGRLEKEITTLQKKLDAARTAASTAREEMKKAEAQRDERRKTREQFVGEQEKAGQKLAELLESGKYDGETDPETLSRFLQKCDARITTIDGNLQSTATKLTELARAREELTGTINSAEQSKAALKENLTSTTTELEGATTRLKGRRDERATRLNERGLSAANVPEGKASDLFTQKNEERDDLLRESDRIDKSYAEAKEKKQETTTRYDSAFTAHVREEEVRTEALRELEEKLAVYNFASAEDWTKATLRREERDRLSTEVSDARTRIRDDEAKLVDLRDALGERTTTAEEVEKLREADQRAEEALRAALKQSGDAERALKDCRVGNEELKKLQSESAEQAKEFEVVTTLRGYLSGNKFIDFIANDRLRHICRTASKELGRLTNGRLHIDAESGSGFYIIDHASGGVERPTASLSGGETFLVSLALALALSESLQMRGAPLEFFFLDEGFGTLDAALLDTVMDALDRIRTESNRTIGIISHVRELHERIPRRLIVMPATETEGTNVLVEVG